MKKFLIIIFVACLVGTNSIQAQIKIEDVLGKVNELLGKKELLTVRKDSVRFLI